MRRISIHNPAAAILGLGFAVVLTAALVSPAPAQLANAVSEEHYYPVGRFSLAAPQAYSEHTVATSDFAHHSVVRHDYIMHTFDGAFSVRLSYSRVNELPTQADIEAFFSDVFSEVSAEPLAQGMGVLVYQERLQWQDYPALDFALDLNTPSGPKHLKVRAVVAGKRLFVVKAASPRSQDCLGVINSLWIAP